MTDRIGHKSPPVHTRFKKGQSGNPKGRPKASLNFRTDLLKELSAAIVIHENGIPRKVTKQRAFIMSLTARALQGDPRAAHALLQAIAKLLPPEPESPARPALSTEDEAILAAFLARHVKNAGVENE